MIGTLTTITEARVLADKEIRRKIADAPRLARYTDFSATNLHSENTEFWTFASGSEAWFKDGGAPAAMFASVSKSDGHVLSRDEVENFYRRRAEEPQAA